MSVVFAVVLLAVLGSFGWWAASSIDDRSIGRQARAVQRGLADIMQRIPIEQDSSAIWDDSVINLRAGNEAWIAENLAEWMSEYFGHDRVYILDGSDYPVRAVSQGVLTSAESYFREAAPIQLLVSELRDRMAEKSAGSADSTALITGLGVEEVVTLSDGQPAIVSIKPVVPGTDEVTQAPGTEYLHISVVLLDDAVAAEIGERYEIPGLAFHPTPTKSSDLVQSPIMNSRGRIIGFFGWQPTEPAFELIEETLPVMLGGVLLGGIAVFLLLRRLRRTSTELEDTQAHATFLAFHDPMTGLPNRALFEDRLTQALANMRKGGTKVALHFIDLDNFKKVNDTLGHPAGDALLRQGANRLTALVSGVDTVARLGGDEFAVIQFDATDNAAAFSLSEKIVHAFEQPFDFDGQLYRAGASVGVTIVEDAALAIEDVMRQADVALYEAKKGGRARYQAYDGELSTAVRKRRELEQELRNALTGAPGLELVYQPIYSARDGSIAGAEALARWVHPTMGRLSPDTFISLAEERGLIDQLGFWALRTACEFAVTSSIPWVAVNASPLQFRDDKFAERVFEILKQTGLPARRLEIEITEGLLLQNSPLTQATLMRLRAGGVRVALDDFGTGYSSISYLRTHGIDKLKIDQSYTAQLGHDQEIDSIVRSIIDLGRAMHMAVTAEGVETREQRDILARLGCDQLQGYLLSRPLQPKELGELVIQPAASIRARRNSSSA